MHLAIITLSEINQTKTNVVRYRLYVASKKMVQMNLFTKQKQTDMENELRVTKGERGEER